MDPVKLITPDINVKLANSFKASDQKSQTPKSNPLGNPSGWDFMTLKQACSPEYQRAQAAFKDSMIHWILQFTLLIAIRCVLHRCESQEIRCWKLYLCELTQCTFCYLWGVYNMMHASFRSLFRSHAWFTVGWNSEGTRIQTSTSHCWAASVPDTRSELR